MTNYMSENELWEAIFDRLCQIFNSDHVTRIIFKNKLHVECSLYHDVPDWEGLLLCLEKYPAIEEIKTIDHEFANELAPYRLMYI